MPDVNSPMMVVRKKLESTSNPNFRTEDGVVQQTGDGGVTWVDSPSNDVRHADAWRLPPIDADDPKCQAAANMTRFLVNWFEELLPILSAAGSAWTLLSILILLFVVLGPFALVIIMLDVAATLLGIGASAIGAAFTTEVFDQLTCIFFCNVDDQGQLNATQLAAVNSDVDDVIGGTAATVLHLIFGLVGEVQVSNWGTQGAAPADCDECPECIVYFCIDIPNPQHGITPGTDTCAGAQNTWFYQLQIAMNEFGSSGIYMVDKMSMDVVYSGSGFPLGYVFFGHGNTNCTYTVQEQVGDSGTGLVHYELEPAWDTAVNRLFFGSACSNNESNSAGNILQITNVRIEGHSEFALPDLLYLYDDYRC